MQMLEKQVIFGERKTERKRIILATGEGLIWRKNRQPLTFLLIMC